MLAIVSKSFMESGVEEVRNDCHPEEQRDEGSAFHRTAAADPSLRSG
jgi:hypothetical protein